MATKVIKPDVDREAEVLRMVEENWNEATGSLGELITEMKEDFRFAMGDQWDDSVRAELEAAGSPVLSLNYIKKQIDVVSGSQRQNRADIKVHPIEGGDEEISEVLTRVIKWVRSDRSSEFTESRAFKDSLIGGLGWLYPRMDFTKDPLNGDIIIDKCSPFNIFPDPNFVKPDLSDCGYILQYKKLSKDKCKELWPEYSDQIEKYTGKNESDGIIEDPTIVNNLGKKLKVVECWYRKLETKNVLVDVENPANSGVWDNKAVEEAKTELVTYYANQKIDKRVEIDAMEEKSVLALLLEINKNLKIMKKKVSSIWLAIVIENEIVVYDGPDPLGGTDFRFIPIFGYYEDSYSEWVLKVQGIVRNLKDPQREKNKRRSQIMRAVNSMPTSGWIVEEGSVSDINDYINGAGPGKILRYNPGRQIPQQITPPQLPVSIMQLEQMSDQDMLRQGPNADLLGMMSERGSPGVTVQLRQKQGLITLQEFFDNLSLAMRTLGRHLVEMILNNFSSDKIKRILGTDCPYYQTEADRRDMEEQLSILRQQMEQAMAGMRQIDQEQNAMGRQTRPENIQMANQTVQQLQQKMQDILLREQLRKDNEKRFWEKFDEMKKTARFDTHVDETVNSPTARIAGILLLTQFQQAGGQVDPMVMLELSDIPKQQKDYIRTLENQRKQMAEQQLAIQQAEQQRMTQEAMAKNQKDLARIEQKTRQQQQEHQQEMARIQLDMQKTYLEILKLKTEFPGVAPEVRTPEEMKAELEDLQNNRGEQQPANQAQPGEEMSPENFS